MKYSAAVAIAGITMFVGSAPDQPPHSPSVEAVQLLSHSRTVSGDSLDQLRGVWSYHDYADTIVVRAVIAGDWSAAGSMILGSVEFQAGRLRGSSVRGPATLTGDDLSQLSWLPATEVLRAQMPEVPPDTRGKRFAVLGAVSPDSVLGTLRRSDPNILLVAMRVRVFLLTLEPGKSRAGHVVHLHQSIGDRPTRGHPQGEPSRATSAGRPPNKRLEQAPRMGCKMIHSSDFATKWSGIRVYPLVTYRVVTFRDVGGDLRPPVLQLGARQIRAVVPKSRFLPLPMAAPPP